MTTKSFEEYMDYLENELGIKMLDFQKEIMRRCYEQKKIYITYPPHVGRTDFRVLCAAIKELLKDGTNNETVD